MKSSNSESLVVPFFRASTRIAPNMRLLFSTHSSTQHCINLLAKADPIFRQNCLRIFTASLVADKSRSTLALFEGWASNSIESEFRPPRIVTGSYLGYLIFTFLKRHQLTPFQGPVLRKNVSCCTWEEVDAIVQLSPRHITAVASYPCPSRRRVSRYFKLKQVSNAAILSPEKILLTYNDTLSPLQKELVNQLCPSSFESVKGLALETPNWLLHTISYLSHPFFAKNRPLESWLAQKLRTS